MRLYPPLPILVFASPPATQQGLRWVASARQDGEVSRDEQEMVARPQENDFLEVVEAAE